MSGPASPPSVMPCQRSAAERGSGPSHLGITYFVHNAYGGAACLSPQLPIGYLMHSAHGGRLSQGISADGRCRDSRALSEPLQLRWRRPAKLLLPKRGRRGSRGSRQNAKRSMRCAAGAPQRAASQSWRKSCRVDFSDCSPMFRV